MSYFSNKKVLFLIVLIIFIAISSIAGYFYKERFNQFVPWRAKKFIRWLDKKSIFDIGVCLCLPDKDVKFKRDDGLIITGSIYGIENPHKSPGIILLHGNTPVGRKLAIYRVMSQEFARKGYLVLSIDFTGFGESDDPFTLEKEDALNGDKDVNTALNYLKGFKNIDRNRLYIIGHSGGAGNAFSVGVKNINIKKIVTIGPPRRVAERFLDPNDRDYFWRRAQENRENIYKKEFPLWYTKDVWLKEIMKSDMKEYINYFSQSLHKPLFLIDGEHESEKDKIFLKKYYSAITEPKKYLTISNSDHYFNTMEISGINFIDKNVMMEVVDEIDQWLKM